MGNDDVDGIDPETLLKLREIDVKSRKKEQQRGGGELAI